MFEDWQMVAVRELRKIKSALHLVKVYLDDGSHRDVALGGIRQKWKRITKTLSSLQWVEIEAMDVNGALLLVLENDDDEDERETFEPSDAVELPEISGTDYLTQMMRGQEFVLDKFSQVTDSTMAAQERVIEMLSTQLELVNAKYLDAMGLIHELSVELAEADVSTIEAEAAAVATTEQSPAAKAAIDLVTGKVMAAVMSPAKAAT